MDADCETVRITDVEIHSIFDESVVKVEKLVSLFKFSLTEAIRRPGSWEADSVMQFLVYHGFEVRETKRSQRCRFGF